MSTFRPIARPFCCFGRIQKDIRKMLFTRDLYEVAFTCENCGTQVTRPAETAFRVW